MEKSESLEEFYKRRFEWIPESLSKDIGHFNVFKLPHASDKPVPYRRRDFFKITFCIGQSRVHYADQVYKIEKQALVFSNPFIPYKWEHLEAVEGGFYLVFNQDFFLNYGDLIKYDVFQPHGTHIFELSDEQAQIVSGIYEDILLEIESDYVHKYDVLKHKVYELLHFALKTNPSAKIEEQPINASQRILWLFQELLERQFPIEENNLTVKLRSPSDFAFNLNVHVNHLNRAVKEIVGKTTSQLIAERLLQEAKILLKQSTWNISEIAFALGYNEVTHFNNFFKKQTGLSPSKFRAT
ncbi:AraC family transcriptional regulator [Jiulongibacter sediminis]|uniref:helix-turn-helix domain-containing protein n=1 Tax=Jiulongibacter sediminis TaxID=1605367 RepID=UPI0026E9DD69|nr:AraC family transcriptional regulator [Jiulongibacter sediminis]